MSEPARFDTTGTDRLLMRRWLASDREPFAALNADPETMLFFPETLDRAASDAFADRIEARFDQLGYRAAGTGGLRDRRVHRLHQAQPDARRRARRRRR